MSGTILVATPVTKQWTTLSGTFVGELDRHIIRHLRGRTGKRSGGRRKVSSTFAGELEREVAGKVEEGGSISCEKDSYVWHLRGSLRCMATLWENWKESGKKVEASGTFAGELE